MLISLAKTDTEILRCFDVMVQLRPHLSRDGFLPRVRSMQEQGFVLAFREEGGAICAVAGFRYLDLLFSGKTLYVDDLITDERKRSGGHGSALLDRLKERATQEGCQTLTLDSGVHRTEAHRFYFRERMAIHGYHFSIAIDNKTGRG